MIPGRSALVADARRRNAARRAEITRVVTGLVIGTESGRSMGSSRIRSSLVSVDNLSMGIPNIDKKIRRSDGEGHTVHISWSKSPKAIVAPLCSRMYRRRSCLDGKKGSGSDGSISAAIKHPKNSSEASSKAARPGRVTSVYG